MQFLTNKLYWNSLTSKALNLLKWYLSCGIHVEIKGMESNTYNMIYSLPGKNNIGVPQCSILGHVLLIIY